MKGARIAIFGAIVVAAMGFLLFKTLGTQAGVYYVTVDEFLADPHPGTVRLSGWVEDGSIERRAGGLRLAFSIRDEAGAQRIRVVYDAAKAGGRIPDTFQEGSPVVITGQLEPDGTFLATQLLAKCPSKYEAADPAGHPASESP
ncbi:MAG: cytochrome c maturation protein CcmE [Acidobacteriota bacterium]